jgi:hypothetical protein
LKNHGVDEEVNAMFEMGEETMQLPMEEKMKFEQGDGGMSFGYVGLLCFRKGGLFLLAV